MRLTKLLILLFLLILINEVQLKIQYNRNEAVREEEFKKYAEERWEDFGNEVQNVEEWFKHHRISRADEVIQVLLYISRLDEPIYIGVELLRVIDQSDTLLEQTRKIAKKTTNRATTAAAAAIVAITEGQVQHHGTEKDQVAFVLGTNGVVPLYGKVMVDEETMEEQLDMGKMIVHIVKTAKQHRAHRKRRLFHKIVGEVFAETGLKSVVKWSQRMYNRITKWDQNANDQLNKLSIKKVALGLKDAALWLSSSENVSGIIQLLLYFTNLGLPIKIATEVITAFGLDETFTKLATQMGVKMVQHGVNERVAMWAFGPNGVMPLFVRQGQKVDATMVMDSIDPASIWYYYKKERDEIQLTVQCKLKIERTDDEKAGKKCPWERHQQKAENNEQTKEGEEVMTKLMEEHLKNEHPTKYEEKQKAQRKKEIIRLADIWHFFQKDEKNGIVKCKLKHENGGKIDNKCNWEITIKKANENELNDHLSLEHMAEFEQRLKAMREKELSVRHNHGDPLANSLVLFQRLTMSLVLYKDRPMDQMVDIVLERLHNWEELLVKKWKSSWKCIKQVQFRDICEAFKQAAMWLITPRHIYCVIKVLFIITMLDAPIYLTVEILKAFGIQRYLFKKLDDASLDLRKRHKGTALAKSLLFMIGEGGVVRLFLGGEQQIPLSLTSSAELLHTVIMTVVHNPGQHVHLLAFNSMEHLRKLRLELSLVRGWNTKWPTIKKRYNEIEAKFNSERVHKIGESVLQNKANSSSNGSKQKQMAEEKQKEEGEDEETNSEVPVEILSNSLSVNWDVPIDFKVIPIELSFNNSSWLPFDTADENFVKIEHVGDVNLWEDEDDSYIMVEHVEEMPNEIQESKLKENEPTTAKTEEKLAKMKKKSGATGCSSSIANVFKNFLKFPKKPNESEKKQQKEEEQPKEQQAIVTTYLDFSKQPVGEGIVDYRFSDQGVPSVIVGTEEQMPDCPREMEQNKGEIDFSKLLDQSDKGKCRTVQILNQKFEVVTDFLDEVIRNIMKTDSEGAIPPVINLRLGNKIPFEKQKILSTDSVRPVSVMFLPYKMGQAGISFDCDSPIDRPRQFVFKDLKANQFVLLLPACAEEAGTISEFAIFKADHFGDFVFEIPIQVDSN